MADKEKDLELHIGANIDEFLKDLALMDKEYQEAVRDIEKKKSEIKLQTRVDISGARALGDKMAEIKARNKELNQLIQLQTEKTRLLKKAWQDVANSQNASKQQVEKALKAYQNAQVALNNLQEKANAGGVSRNLSLIAPDTYRKIEQIKSTVASIGAEYPAIAKIAPAVTGIGTAAVGTAAALVGVYKGFEAVSESAQQAAKEAADAGDKIYDLREKLGLNEADAKVLNDVFRLDGTDIAGLTKSLQNINLALKTASEEGTRASRALAQYGENLRNMDGSAKNTREQIEAIARAYQKAVEIGPTKGLELLTDVFGGRGVNFTSLFAGFDTWNEKAQSLVRSAEDVAMSSHAYNDALKLEALQAEHLGNIFKNKLVPEMTKVVDFRRELEAQRGTVQLGRESDYKRAAENIGGLSMQFEKMQAILGRTGDEWRGFLADLSNTKAGKVLSGTFDAFLNLWGKGLGLDFEKAEQNAVAAFKKAQEDIQKQADSKPIEQEVEVKVKANDKLDKFLRDAKLSDYARELTHINDEVEAFYAAGNDKLKAEEYFLIKKAELDKRYAEKQSSEVEKARRDAAARVQAAQQAMSQMQAVWKTETQRRIAEIERQKEAWVKAGAAEVEATRAAEKMKADARMSEAERTLRENVKLVRKMQQEEAAGGDWQSRVQAWQDRQYMKKNGFKAGDISALQRYGTDLVNQMANSRDRVFSGFGGGQQTNNNTVNINLDNTVVENEAAMVNLANKVADKILPVIQRAVGGSGNTVNSF